MIVHMLNMPRRPALSLLALAFTCLAMLVAAGGASAANSPGWSIRSISQPTNFSTMNNVACESAVVKQGGPGVCDSYTLIVTNVGGEPTEPAAPVTIADRLPAGMHAVVVAGEDTQAETALSCSTVSVQCSADDVPVGDTLIVTVYVTIEASAEVPGVINVGSVSGGGAPAATTEGRTSFGSAPASFGIADFDMQAFDGNGIASTQAGGHPYALGTSLYFNSYEDREEGGFYGPSQQVKDAIVDLPPGFVGNPQTTPKCPLYELLQSPKQSGVTECPPGSRIGTAVFEALPGTFRLSEAVHSGTTAVYNMQPEPGFPAEFGFTYLTKPVFMYASPVRIDGQLRLRVTVPGIPEVYPMGVTLLFFGDPMEQDGGPSTSTPFFANPVDCAVGPLSATVEADSWQDQDLSNQRVNFLPAFAEATVYPRLESCDMLQFQPALGVGPETTQADEPSGYTVTVTNPQNESRFTPATPELKDATVTLPPGVSLSPAAADGLRACQATGPEGINIGSGVTAAAGQDVGDPEATELGAGYLGGENETSPYDDGLYHTAPGHCPAASTIGTVEVETPLLAGPLEGHVYVAQPACGGGGQPECTPEDAVDGRLFGLYLEAAGSGSIIKLAGSASVNLSTGQITASFRENPQLPFSSLKLHLTGGPRAPLANPQTCGTAVAAADFSAWSSPITLDSYASSPFAIDWDGAGGACPGTPPLTPSMVAETTNPTAGEFSPFSFTLTRGDRQQYLSQLSVTTPPGLLAMISSVPLCAEAQAAVGRCLSSSEIGTATVAAGAGSHPYWVTGHVYLTESYGGAPFGLSIVVPAQAGPFNLGNVVVRSAITVDPNTSVVTITSTPLPQVIDGVPLRVQTVNVDIDRRGFVFNPTNCSSKQVTATVTGAQGTQVQVSSPFVAGGCKRLPFDPSFTASTRARTSKTNGAALSVRVAYKAGQANIRSVAVTLPKQLPARLTTIQQACLAATFEANPAACPAGSLIGIAKARTPVLSEQLSGPVYLVSHGGAAFPDVVIILQEGKVRVDLTGNINIVKGITSSTFANVPDVPVTSFELNLPEGSHSALATNLPAKDKGDFCGVGLSMPTTIRGQNGLQITQSTKISISGCPRQKKTAKKKAKARVRARTSGHRWG
jgi:hypothetical protein